MVLMTSVTWKLKKSYFCDKTNENLDSEYTVVINTASFGTNVCHQHQHGRHLATKMYHTNSLNRNKYNNK